MTDRRIRKYEQTESEIKICHATSADIRDIAVVDKERWNRIPGVTALTKEELTAWLDQRTPYFLVAKEYDQEQERWGVVGYYVGIYIDFYPNSVFINKFRSSASLPIHGYTEHTHNPAGNCLYGINITSKKPAAAAAIHQHIVASLKKSSLMYMVGMARLSLLRAYMRSLEHTKYSMQDIATEYALRQIQKEHGFQLWDETPKPRLDIPTPRHRDQVLSHHTENLSNHTLLATLPYLIHDKKSAGWGALLTAKL